MTPIDLLLLFSAGLLGGAVNAVAGGGTFFTFPALIASGLDPLTANVCNAVAIYPGHAAAVPAYREELRRTARGMPLRLAVVAAASLAGALLLLLVGNEVFETLVPWLLLIATLIFAYSRTLRAVVARSGETPLWIGLATLVVFSVYGGFFGAGLGVLLLTALILVDGGDVQSANAHKNLYATLVTSVSVAAFILADAIIWPPTLAVMAGALAGGYAGGRLARKASARAVHAGVVAIGLALSVYYFHQVYGA